MQAEHKLMSRQAIDCMDTDGDKHPTKTPRHSDHNSAINIMSFLTTASSAQRCCKQVPFPKSLVDTLDSGAVIQSIKFAHSSTVEEGQCGYFRNRSEVDGSYAVRPRARRPWDGRRTLVVGPSRSEGTLPFGARDRGPFYVFYKLVYGSMPGDNPNSSTTTGIYSVTILILNHSKPSPYAYTSRPSSSSFVGLLFPINNFAPRSLTSR
jgi:hypothetical protein